MAIEGAASVRVRSALSHVARHSSGPALSPDLRITLNFHPDRLVGGVTVLHALARDGAYHSQFVTGVGNGGLTAHLGGDRWRWESRIFAGAYDDADPAERPVYGALNFRDQNVGAAPRFGSAHLRLGSEALRRTTFCYPDSWSEPSDFGVHTGMSLLGLAEADHRDALDDYIEAHVHGGVALARDAEAIVLDPCYRDTEIEAAARTLPCPLEWHPGYRLNASTLHRYAAYRGREYTDLGARIARTNRLDPTVLDAAVIGTAARAGDHDPQDLKKVWHILARFGAPAGAGTARAAE
ncbi:DUF3626 domain-containing protein [Nocardia bovistercoris]|uniref:DUF3626 domain-containing protein n=1 Tax=Nocardia bovistercoris TaxID=2785916 RepID=A0A931IDV5_9NOCA|nr:DUF3626 domain-containing protein [Nocardia bovistercoris]MBH0777963.1 DUF3626 domain-containing protein [Nocardia bovistercoris]